MLAWFTANDTVAVVAGGLENVGWGLAVDRALSVLYISEWCCCCICGVEVLVWCRFCAVLCCNKQKVCW